MFRKLFSRRSSDSRSQLFRKGRSLRFESMEGRMMLTASGFANECAPEIDEQFMAGVVPTGTLSPTVPITFEFNAADAATDGGNNATPNAEIDFMLDPDVPPQFRSNGATPIGASLTETSPGTWMFSWTPTVQQQGVYRMFLIATDDGGGTGIPLSDVYAFELTIDNSPTIDLNGDDDPDVDFGPVNFNENGPAVSIVDTDLSIPFAMNDMVQSATARIVNPQSDELEVLDITNPGALVTNYDPTTGILTLTAPGGGLASKADFEAALQSLTYGNSSDSPELMRTIEVSINDGTSNSNVAEATVSVTANNDRPNLLQNNSIPNGLVNVQHTFDIVAEDPDAGDLLVFKIESGPNAVITSPDSQAGGSSTQIQVARGQDGLFHATITWTPSPTDGDASPVEFGVSVTDSGGLPDSEIYTVVIDNQAPVANDDPGAGSNPIEVGEDDPATDIGNILDNDDDADEDDFNVSEVIVNGSPVPDASMFTTAKGALVTIDADGNVTYDPNDAFESLAVGDDDTDTFDYKVVDENGNESNTATVSVRIVGANDLPTQNTTPLVFMVDEGEPSSELANFLDMISDVDNGDVVSFFGGVVPALPMGSLSVTSDTISFLQMPGEFDLLPGVQSAPIDFTIPVKDLQDAFASIEARVIVVGVNDPPVANDDPANIGDYDTDEDTTLTVNTRAVGLLGNDTDDVDPALLEVAEVRDHDMNLVPFDVSTPLFSNGIDEGSLTISRDGTFSFTPSDVWQDMGPGALSGLNFRYWATDGISTSNEASVSISISGVNDEPVAVDDGGAAFTTDEDTTLTGANVLDNDTDAEMDSLFLVSVNGNMGDVDATRTVTSAGGRDGQLTVTSTGAVTFVPGPDFNALAHDDPADTYTFSYEISDGQPGSAPQMAMATISITGVNDPPSIDETQLAAAIQAAASLSSTPDLSQPIEVPNNAPLNFDFSSVVSDPDTPTTELGYSLDGTFPAGLNQPSIDVNGQFTWSPNASSVPTDVTFTLNVIDNTEPGSVLSRGIELTFRLITRVI